MAENFDVSIGITSYAGVRVPFGSIRVAAPSIQTIEDLNGNLYASSGTNQIVGAITNVSPLAEFEFIKGKISDPQTFSFTNAGTAPLVITGITYSSRFAQLILDPTYPVDTISANESVFVDQTNNPDPIIVPPNGGQFAYDFRYTGPEAGEFTGVINLFITDYANGYLRISTRQRITESNDFIINESPGILSTVTIYGGKSIHEYTITPIINGDISEDTLVTPTAVITSLYPGWSVSSTSDNAVNIKFNSLAVYTSVETSFTATIAISAFNKTRSVVSQVDLAINPNLNKNYGSWLSEGSSTNSIIGISYDIIGGIKYITIGVGMGGDTTPEYSNGGNTYVSTSTIGLIGAELGYPYTAWATVYRIPVQPNNVYDSLDLTPDGLFAYRVKTTEGYNYEDYFGVEGQIGSMFTVECFNDSSINIRMNMLRELKSTTEEGYISFNTTLQNLSRAFYNSTPETDDRFTKQFYGFTTAGKVITYTVSTPT